jgi:hypothetical protein
MARRERYREAALQVARYLAERQRPDGGFPGPDNYGVASALCLWSQFGTEFARQLDRAWQRLKERPPRGYGEFNIYALLHCRQTLGADPVDALLRHLRFGARHSANWMLLRACCRALPGPHFAPTLAALEARLVLLRYLRRGFIADRPGVRSFAYHAFCGALLADLWQARGWQWAGRAAAQAAHFLADFALPNGDVLYLGRGQQQIFGCGALLCLFERAEPLTGNARFADRADRVFDRLSTFQRPDGSFPLVLSEGEPLEPWDPERPLPGWYSYNRYADYLPFLGCMLLKASAPAIPALGEVGPAPFHPDFRLCREDRYVAVLARPGGAPTNDLPFPYVCVSGVSLFPCYGVEGDHVAPESHPLPYGVLADGRSYGFRDRVRYQLTDDGLAGGSSLVLHRRRFDFAPDGFTCRDEIRFRRPCSFASFTPTNFLFRSLQRVGSEFETWHRGVRARIQAGAGATAHADAAVTASGPLVALRRTESPLRAERGKVFSTELRIRFL